MPEYKTYYINIYGNGKKNESKQLDAYVYDNYTDASIGSDGNIPFKLVKVIELTPEILMKVVEA